MAAARGAGDATKSISCGRGATFVCLALVVVLVVVEVVVVVLLGKRKLMRHKQIRRPSPLAAAYLAD